MAAANSTTVFYLTNASLFATRFARRRSNMKRTFVCGEDRDWMNKEEGEGSEFLRESCEVKNVWMPMGESMPGVGAAY